MKTVTFDEEAYRILRGLKLGPDDSFSDVVKRHLGRGTSRPRLEDSAGGWSDVTDEEVRELRRQSVRAFGVVGRGPRRRR